LIQPVPDRNQLSQRRRRVRVGDRTDPDELAAWLVDHGFRRTDAVEMPGEFSRRGGILDLFSPDEEAPIRVEFFGEGMDSIRQFSAQPRRSRGTRREPNTLALGEMGQGAASNGKGAQKSVSLLTAHVCDFLPADAWTALIDPDELQQQG